MTSSSFVTSIATVARCKKEIELENKYRVAHASKGLMDTVVLYIDVNESPSRCLEFGSEEQPVGSCQTPLDTWS